MRAHFTFASLLALALFGVASRPAHAQSTCSTDAECVKGWTCQVSGGTACASPACPPGEKCEPQASDCVAQEFKSCQPGACQADGDCADGMVCYTHTETNCAPNACAAGQECPQPSCEPTTTSACVPRYVLPCATASDCGSGFQCAPSGEECACSGSAGSGTPSSAGSGSAGTPEGAAGGAPPSMPSEPDCVCQPSTELRCQAASVTCEKDGDCPADWSCAAVSAGGGCAKAPSSNPAPGSDAQGGGAAAPDCVPPVAVKQCVPPYYALLQGAQSIAHESGGVPTIGAGDASGNNAGVPPVVETSKDDDATASAGCSLGHGSGAGSALAVLGVLGLFGGLRRRRAS